MGLLIILWWKNQQQNNYHYSGEYNSWLRIAINLIYYSNFSFWCTHTFIWLFLKSTELLLYPNIIFCHWVLDSASLLLFNLFSCCCLSLSTYYFSEAYFFFIIPLLVEYWYWSYLYLYCLSVNDTFTLFTPGLYTHTCDFFILLHNIW